ncbi:MAG: glycosyl hydrolase family 8, partial [Alphaproteobacteria bacterium]
MRASSETCARSSGPCPLAPWARRPRVAILAAILLASVGCASPTFAAWTDLPPSRPFGSHPLAYAAGSIRPNHVSQGVLDQAVRDFWAEWKAAYLAEACGAGRRVVLAGVGSGNLTVSEAHGYGMMLAALMAGHDPEAQAIFDGMVAFYREHPSELTPGLMAWNQSRSCQDAQGADSASDGDLDIAFALLLADRQWGSCGAVDYAEAANTIIAAIRAGDLDPSGRIVKLGDWVANDGSAYADATRSSDFMPDHARAFAQATSDPSWAALVERTWEIVGALQAGSSPSTGLLPDFVTGALSTPAPAPAGFLEGPNDGAWGYNACRDPWRLATDWLVNGETRARTAVNKVETWIRAATGGDPTKIRSGYRLDGTPSAGSDYVSMAFVAPIGAGATVDAAHQGWLNDVWDLVVATPLADGGYYENTLKLLSMIVMSGNWWSPEKLSPPSCTPPSTPLCTAGGSVAATRVDVAGLGRSPGAQAIKLTGTLAWPQGRPEGFPLDAGTQLLVEDLGSGGATLLELTTATHVVPGATTVACDPRKDRWKTSGPKVLYVNGSGAVDPPSCTEGSAGGLSKLQFKQPWNGDLDVQVQTKKQSLAGPVVGPLRVSVVPGPGGSAGDAGACAVSEPLACR